MGVRKDGLEQPFVKDRHSLTGADADTSAMALHHLPFTGQANHAPTKSLLALFLSCTLPHFFCYYTHMHMRSRSVITHVYKQKWERSEISTQGTSAGSLRVGICESLG